VNCQLQQFDLTSGVVDEHTLRLPPGSAFYPSVASPDGHYLAGVLDPRVGAVGSDAAEKNLAVLDLQNFELTNVPDIEFDPGQYIVADQPGTAAMAYSADSQWLVLGVPGPDTTTRLLLWKPGLARPLESAVVVPGAPQPFVVVSDEIAASLTD
jgi:hypothetical protein